MSQKRRKKLRITDVAQRDAIASPLRLEALEHLRAIGPATVRDLAERMGRSSHTLHYHMRLLADVDLVRRVGRVKSGPRDESLFDVVADQFEIEPSGDGSGNQSELKTVRAVLRRAEREFQNVLEHEPERFGKGECLAGRLRAPLSAGARKELIRHVRAIQNIFAEEMRADHPPQAKLETWTFTLVLTPETREPG